MIELHQTNRVGTNYWGKRRLKSTIYLLNIFMNLFQISEVVLPFLAPKNAKSILRNVFLFICVLIPIGIHDGMF